MASLVDAEFDVLAAAQQSAKPGSNHERPIAYNGETFGALHWDAPGDPNAMLQAVDAIGSVLEHAVGREEAIDDLAEALSTNYEELNMLYALLPNVATKVREDDIGAALVEWAAQTLHCERVSLLALDPKRQELRVLASHGLPADVLHRPIPVSESIAGKSLSDEDFLVLGDISERPDLQGISRGTYDGAAFAVIRVPLQARGEPLGVLTATERIGDDEFTARDCKLLEGLSAIGASALLNCRLHAQMNRQMLSTIKALASAVDAKDQYTHAHSDRVSHLCVALAKRMKITDRETLRLIELAGLLHDIGKIGVPDAILSKTEKLTQQEYAVVKTHVDIGANIVSNVDGLDEVARAIKHHHERFDGLGYPAGLAGEDIPLASRLIAVSDAFDSLTSDRCYRKGTDTKRALSELNRFRGTQFDPALLDLFNQLAETSPELIAVSATA